MSRGLAPALAGLGAGAALVALATCALASLGGEPVGREVFLAALLCAAAVARPSRARPALGLAALAALVILGLLGLEACAGVLARLAGRAPEDAGRSVALRSTALGLLGALAGGALGHALAGFTSARSRLLLLGSGALGLIVPPSWALVGLAPLGAAARFASAGPTGTARNQSAVLSRSPLATLGIALSAGAVLGAAPLVARMATLGGEVSPGTILSLLLAAAVLGATALARLPRAARTRLAVVLAVGSLGATIATLVLAPRLLTAGALAPPAALAGAALLAGAACSASPRDAARGLALAALLSPAIERGGACPIARASWSKADAAWLALGASPARRSEIASTLASGELVLRRFEVGPSGAVAVLDSMAANARELVREGSLLGSTPAIIGSAPSGAPLETRADVRSPLLAVVLAETLGHPGGRVAVLGFGEGLAARAFGETEGLEQMALVEPDATIRAFRDDPDDLFHGSWKESKAVVVGEDARPFLRRSDAAFDAILDQGGLLAFRDALESARARLAPGAALVRIARAGPTFAEEARAFARVFPEALAFRPPRSPGTAILVGGVARIDSSMLSSLAGSDRPLARRATVARLPLANLRGTFVAGADALAAARSPEDLVPTRGDVVRFLAAQGAHGSAASFLELAAGEGANPAVALALCAFAREAGGENLEQLCETEGSALYALGREAEAATFWKRALELDAGAMIPRIDLATLHYNRGELDLARTILKDGLSGDFQRDRPLNFYLGNIALKQGHYLAAKAYYESALDFQGSTERAELADRLYQQEKKALEGAPRKEEDPHLLAEKARLILDDADRKEAKILARGDVPGDQDAAYLKLQRQDARKWLEQAAPKLGSDPGVLVDLGRARGAVGDVEGAREALENAARLAPSNGRPLFLLGEILRKKGRLTEALSVFQRALERGPVSSASARTYLAIAEILGSLGKPEQAVRTLEECENVAPGHPLVPANLALLYLRLGRKKDAEAAYRRYKELITEIGEPEDPTLRYRIQEGLKSP